MKMLILFMLALFITSSARGNTMEKSVSHQNKTTVKQAIVEHVKRIHSIQEDNIKVEDLSLSLSSLPRRYNYYRVERKDRTINNFVCFYTVVNGELFSSSIREDFARLLKQEKFLENKNFTPSQFVSLFNLMFSIPINQNVVISLEHVDDSEKDMVRILELDKNKDKLPQMKEIDSGREIVFWGFDTSTDIWKKSTVKVSKDYKVTREIEEKSADN